MSSPEAKRPTGHQKLRRRTVLCGLASLVGVSTLTAGCTGGIRPLYGTLGANANAKLARVQIGTIPGRVGQRIRNELRFHTTDNARNQPPLHKLEVAVRQSSTTTLVQRDGNSSGQVVNLDAEFRLIRISDQRVVLRGTSFARAGFERNLSIYANVRAKRDAEDRAARTIATDLRSRLAAFLAT